MRQISLPLPRFDDDERVEIKVQTGSKGRLVQFRLEPVHWETDEELLQHGESEISLYRINRLKLFLESYDKSWELIQIFAPLKNSDYLRVLYRKKRTNLKND